MMFPAMIGASFDPITDGHMWLIQQVVKRHELHVAIATNPAKKYTFSEKKREEMLSAALEEVLKTRAANVRIHLITNEYLARFAKAKGVQLLYRGIRNEDDFAYERSMRHINAGLEPDVDTHFLIPPQELEYLSSSFVKGMCGPNGWEKEVVKLVPTVVYHELLKEFDGTFYCVSKISGGRNTGGCGAKLTAKERTRFINNRGGECDKCNKAYISFAESR